MLRLDKRRKILGDFEMTEKNENKALEIAIGRVEEAKKRRTRISEGLRAEQVSHAEGAQEVRPTKSKAIIKTLVNNKVDENTKADIDAVESQRVTDVKLKHFDKNSEREFLDYAKKALRSAHIAKKTKESVKSA
jgi:hypothetical protein